MSDRENVREAAIQLDGLLDAIPAGPQRLATIRDFLNMAWNYGFEAAAKVSETHTDSEVF